MQFRHDGLYPSRRSPVLARNVVAASQPLATQAGLRMLEQGGNALDAALAAAITLTVVEPTGNGIGSDAYCILWDGKELHGLNASGRSPAGWTPKRFAATRPFRVADGRASRCPAPYRRGLISRRNLESCRSSACSSRRSPMPKTAFTFLPSSPNCGVAAPPN